MRPEKRWPQTPIFAKSDDRAKIQRGRQRRNVQHRRLDANDHRPRPHLRPGVQRCPRTRTVLRLDLRSNRNFVLLLVILASLAATRFPRDLRQRLMRWNTAAAADLTRQLHAFMPVRTHATNQTHGRHQGHALCHERDQNCEPTNHEPFETSFNHGTFGRNFAQLTREITFIEVPFGNRTAGMIRRMAISFRACDRARCVVLRQSPRRRACPRLRH